MIKQKGTYEVRKMKLKCHENERLKCHEMSGGR